MLSSLADAYLHEVNIVCHNFFHLSVYIFKYKYPCMSYMERDLR